MSTSYFLALDGVQGDSLNSTYKGWFEVNNFDIDLAGAAASAGTAAFSPLTLTLDSNSGLAPLLALAATGERLNGATLVGVTDGVGQPKVYQLDLADVLVANVEHHADAITEVGPTLTLDYGKIELQTFTQNGTGSLVPEGQFGFDLAANTDGITVPSEDPGGSVAASPQPMDYFMLIDGLNGGSLDAQHKGWFEIKGVDLDIQKLVAGEPLNVTLSGDVELADVMRLAATGRDPSTGRVIEGVRIEGFAAGVNRAKVYDLTLANVAVTEVVDSEDRGYSLSLDYSKIALVTNGIDATGTPTKNGEFAYDVTNNTEIAPFSLDLSPASSGGGLSPAMYFLALDGVRGDLDPSFKGPGQSGLGHGWFEVKSFDFDMQGVGLPGPGGIVEKAAFSPLTLTLDSNTALPPLLMMAATGELSDTLVPPPSIKAATLVGVAGDGQTVLYRLDLAGPGLADDAPLPITKVEDVAGAGLTLTLDAARIELQTFTQDNKGVVSLAGDFTWNETTNSDDLGHMPSVESTKIAPSPEPATYFMLIDGLNGGSTDSQHKGWFEVTNLELDLQNTAPLSKPNFSSLNVTLPQEAGLADVMDLAATNGLVKGVRIEGFTGGTTPAEVYELTLADVAVSNVADGEGDGYSLSLDYGKIALVTNPQAGSQARQFTYDLVHNNTSFNPSSLALNPDSSGGPVTPAKYFLALDGVKGDSLDASHKGWFEVTNFDVDVHHLFSVVPGGPADPGKPIFSPLTLTLDSNSGLAPLLELAATAGHLNDATLVGVTAGPHQDEVYQLDLADVQVTKVEDDAGAGPTLTLDYGKIELETFTQNATGGRAPEGQFGFDLAANRDGITVPSADPGGSVAASPQPMDYFMLIDGLNGGSLDAQHKRWFEITGFDLDLANATVVAGGTGAAAFSPLSVTLSHEAGLADVLDLAATGGHVKGVRIEGTSTGAAPAEVYDLTLADVQMTKVADGEGDGYSLSLDYSKIALVTNGIDTTGQPTPNGAFGYDIANNIAIAPFSLDLSPSGNQVPVANAQSISTDEDTAVAVMLSGSDPDGDSLTFTVVSAPVHGTLSGTGANLTYTPAANYNGPDAFTYTANDGAVDSAVAIISLTVNPVNDADLSVTVDDGRTTVAPGSVDTYTITVTNNGPDTVTSLTLTDAIPGALLSPNFAPSVGAYNVGTGQWSGLSLASGQSVSMTLSGTINPNAIGTITNIVTVAAPGGTTDPNPGNNVATDSDTLTSQADLAITVTDGATTVVPGTIDTYTITVSNNGPDTVTSLTLIEAIPAALSSPIFAPSVGAYDVGTGQWSGLSLTSGQSVSMTLSGAINPNATGLLTNIVAVAPPAGTIDTNPANNAATDTDTVTLPADLQVTITDAATTVVPGTVDTYTITVTNNGPSTVSSFNLVDAIPDALSNATFGSPSAGSYDRGSGLWSDLSLASGQSVFIALSGVIGIATGTLSNTVTVSSLIDTNPGNNVATDSDTLTLFSSPNPSPPPATSANMFLRRADGMFAIYDIGNNATLAAHPLAQVGSDWQFAGLGSVQTGAGTAMFLRQQDVPGPTGSFEIYNISNNNVISAALLGHLNGEIQGIGNFGSRGENDVLLRDGTAFVVADIANDQISGLAPLGTVGLNWQLGGFGNFSGNPGEYDMLLRDMNSGGLQVYDIANDQITNSAFIGTVGLDWQVSGFGGFGSPPGETDMIMRNSSTGALQVYDIANNQITGTAFLGTVGLEWQFAGVAPGRGAGTSDLILRNVNTGEFEAYDIANNQIIGAASLGQVGLEWQIGGFAGPAPASMARAGSVSQLVQAMAGFDGGGGAADSSNIFALGADTSQQTFLTTPQHA
jgi:uncharacterized repeat protein (TIGR01451 family)